LLPKWWATNLGNNQATKIANKVAFGNKEEKNIYAQYKEKQSFRKQENVNYFPIQKV
jgi:ApbE superfamily uncharacterized protein (UPF0280 family)